MPSDFARRMDRRKLRPRWRTCARWQGRPRMGCPDEPCLRHFAAADSRSAAGRSLPADHLLRRNDNHRLVLERRSAILITVLRIHWAAHCSAPAAALGHHASHALELPAYIAICTTLITFVYRVFTGNVSLMRHLRLTGLQKSPSPRDARFRDTRCQTSSTPGMRMALGLSQSAGVNIPARPLPTMPRSPRAFAPKIYKSVDGAACALQGIPLRADFVFEMARASCDGLNTMCPYSRCRS